MKLIIVEKWSAKYKRSINCSHPKGFSQRAHCQGRKKKVKEDIDKIKSKQKLRLDYADERDPKYIFDEKVPKEFLFNFKGYKVYSVDGNYVRNNIDIDFNGGGNPSRYQYVPDKQIWIEKLSNNAESDIMGYTVHEYIECERMKKLGETYEVAHDRASQVEKKVRKHYEKK